MKLPAGYVAGQGVKKASGFGGFGQKMLERMGWQKGQGLGKEKHGMKDAIEVKEKKDTTGIGANASWNWEHKFWEEAFNSAVKNINHDVNSSSSSSDSDSDDDSDSSSRLAEPALKVNRDGTFATASTDEMKIAKELAKDPWGRWGGRAGKMARIKAMEEAAAAAARAKLGLADPPALPQQQPQEASTSSSDSESDRVEVDASAKKRKKKNDDDVASKTSKKDKKRKRDKEGDDNNVEASAPAPKRIVVVLGGEDLSMKAIAAAFKPTPKEGWWGAKYFTPSGSLEGLDEADDPASKQRQTFNEDDQAALYKKVHDAQRVGRKGLGQNSGPLKIAGGKWEGSKKTFDEGSDDDGDGTAAPQQQPDVEEQGDEQSPDKKSKKNKESKSKENGFSKKEIAKLAKKLLKKAANRKLKIKELCKQIVRHASSQGLADLEKDHVRQTLVKKAESSKGLQLDGKYIELAA